MQGRKKLTKTARGQIFEKNEAYLANLTPQTYAGKK